MIVMGLVSLVAIFLFSFWLAQPTTPRETDAIVVLGGSHERGKHAVALFEQGLAPRLWHTGWWNRAAPPLSSGELLETKIDGTHSIPEDRITFVYTTDTWEDGQAIARLVQEQSVRSLLIVTDWPHSRRALCVAQHALRGVDVAIFYDAPPDSPVSIDGWWWHSKGWQAVVREMVALSYYWLAYGVSPWGCSS